MKNILKIILIFSFAIITFNSCDNDKGVNDGKFDANEESGWVQFQSNESQIWLDAYNFDEVFEIPVEVNVPVVKDNLTINYSLVGVSGVDPNTVFSNNGSIVSPAGFSSNFDLFFPSISFDISEALNITETLIFDVVLESTNKSTVQVGISGSEDTRPTTYRVSICPIVLSRSDFVTGDFNLTVTSGSSLFGGDVFADQVVSIQEGNNGANSREFDVVYEPGGPANSITITFSIDTSNGQVNIGDGISTNIACEVGELLLIGGDATNIFSFNPCTVLVTDTTLMLNMLDFQGGSGGCGVGDVPLTVVLTKV